MDITIYKIQSTVNGKVYIGLTSREVNARWIEHKCELKRNKHHNKFLQNHYNKYGDVLEYSVIHKGSYSGKEALSVEMKYIKKYKSTDKDKGFNLSEGGKGCFGYANEASRVLTKNQAQYIKNLSFFKIHEYYKLAEKYNCEKHTVISIAKGLNYKDVKINFKSYDEFLWYEQEAEKYRLSDLGDRIIFLYNYYQENPDIMQLSRSIRQKIRPESLKTSWLKDDYKYKDMIQYIIKRCENDKLRVIESRIKETEDILRLLIEGNNCRETAKILNITPEKVNRIKLGKQYPNYCIELREKLKLNKRI